MNSKMIFLSGFVMGLASGSFGAWYYAKKYYERIAQEEIDSVKEAFATKEERESEKTDDISENNEAAVKTDEVKPNIVDYAAKLHKEGYTNYSSVTESREDEEMNEDKPYVIPPESFMENDEYEHTSLTYYADGVLTDENDEVIDDVDAVVGEDALNHFGEYEDDSVYVRDDVLKIEYEILLDQRNYSDVAKHKPHQMEV